MKKTPEEAAATRRKLMEAAVTVINRQGLAETRLEDVAREAGYTRGAIYWHFSNKEDLIKSLMQQYLGDISDKLANIYQSDQPPHHKLQQLLRESLLSLEQDPDYQSGIRLALSIQQADGSRNPLAPKRRAHLQVMLTHLKQIFDECAEASLLRSDVTSTQAALALLMWYDGVALFWLRNQDNPPFSLQMEANRLITIMLRGVLNEESVQALTQE